MSTRFDGWTWELIMRGVGMGAGIAGRMVAASMLCTLCWGQGTAHTRACNIAVLHCTID